MARKILHYTAYMLASFGTLSTVVIYGWSEKWWGSWQMTEICVMTAFTAVTIFLLLCLLDMGLESIAQQRNKRDEIMYDLEQLERYKVRYERDFEEDK